MALINGLLHNHRALLQKKKKKRDDSLKLSTEQDETQISDYVSGHP